MAWFYYHFSFSNPTRRFTFSSPFAEGIILFHWALLLKSEMLLKTRSELILITPVISHWISVHLNCLVEQWIVRV